jgi:pSer/pThr/pTyr-binding forkhead associated (FHA) protein
MASLIINAGPHKGNYFPLGKRTNVVGRDEGAQIQLLDDHVSRKHVQIRFDKDSEKYYAQDLKSRHGVFVNGQRISAEALLKEEDLIDVGSTTLFFTLKDFADKQSALAYHKTVGERFRGTLME